MKITLFIAALALSLLNLSADRGMKNLSGPYFGRQPPEEKCEIFLDGIICRKDEAEMCAAFAHNGMEFYFNKMYRGKWAIFFSRESGGAWSSPQPVNFTDNYTDRDFTLSPDGNRIYFGSNRPLGVGGEPATKLDIWVSTRKSDGSWSAPQNLGPPVNTVLYGENYPSVSNNGNLYYFSCRESGYGGCDLYFAENSGGKYLVPVPLGPEVNSDKNDWDSFIAPDESYIIFSSQNRDDTFGGQDLYISFNNGKKWSKAINMGPGVNSFSGEICPSVSPDGRKFFFTSRRRGKADIFWISAKIINRLKQNQTGK